MRCLCGMWKSLDQCRFHPDGFWGMDSTCSVLHCMCYVRRGHFELANAVSVISSSRPFGGEGTKKLTLGEGGFIWIYYFFHTCIGTMGMAISKFT